MFILENEEEITFDPGDIITEVDPFDRAGGEGVVLMDAMACSLLTMWNLSKDLVRLPMNQSQPLLSRYCGHVACSLPFLLLIFTTFKLVAWY